MWGALYVSLNGWRFFFCLWIDPGKAPQIPIFENENNFPPITFWWIMK